MKSQVEGRYGNAEFAGVDSAERTIRHGVAGMENAGVDNAAPPGKGGQCGSGQCRSGEMRVKLSSIVMTGKESVL